MSHSAIEWAAAIAGRLADEWDGKRDFPEDAALLEDVLEKALLACPNECMKLVGTGVIEESYFERLD
jgi:ferredoxin